MMITATATMRVTPMMCVMSNVSQALVYQAEVNCSGNQVLNHCFPNESTTKLTRMPISKMKNAATPAHTNHVVGEATSDRSPGARAAFFLVRVGGEGRSAPGVLVGAVFVSISPCLLSSLCTRTTATSGRWLRLQAR